jgi:outer membrane beta-barrel protein
MESRLQRIFLTILWGSAALLSLGSLQASAETELEELELEPLIVREPERRQIEVDQLDRENFEIGAFGGVMNVEDFGSNTVVGVRFAYHVTEDFFVEGTYAQTDLGLTSFEKLSGGAQLISSADRKMTYYNVNIGWNIFPGESFVAGRWAFKGGLYAVAGAGSTEFAGDDLFTMNFGLGYRFIATDWLALHVDVRDHIFESDLLGTKETKHNVEFSGGLTVFF